MPRHEFRTIEEFVQQLEKWSSMAHDRAMYLTGGGRTEQLEQMRREGERDAYDKVCSILRTSNIGIVYPPSGEPNDKG